MRIRCCSIVLFASLFSIIFCGRARPEDMLFKVADAPAHGLVVADVDLTDAVRWCKLAPAEPGNIRARQLADGKSVPLQFVPATDFDPATRVAGTLILRLPAGGSARLRLSFDSVEPGGKQTASNESMNESFAGVVATKSYRIVHDATKMGGLPSRFEFLPSGKVFERFRWNDRVHDPETGSFNLSNDPQAWPEPTRQWSAWLWIGAADHPVEAIRSAAAELPGKARVEVAVASVDEKIAAAKQRWLQQQAAARQQTWWQPAGAAQLAGAGRFQQAIEATEGKMPDNCTVVNAGRLGIILERGGGGIRLLSLFDTAADRQLGAADSEPLFELVLRDVQTKQESRLLADTGWREACVVPLEAGPGVELRWKAPIDERFGPLEAVVQARPNASNGSIAWKLSVGGVSDRWSLWRVVFPKVAVKELGSESMLFWPRGCGQLETNAWRRALNSGGRYPSGWTTMQFMAAYAADGSTGLYSGLHDPLGSTKEIRAQSHPDHRKLVLSFEHPVPEMGKPGNRFELCGEAVWQHLAGDWFDAAVIYRQWVRRHAEWYPQRTKDGRADTPKWMRELPVWGLGGGDPKSGLPVLQKFAEQMGLPVGFHWYSWHQIPFDNDYPHYFPPDEGFAGAVQLLQSKNTYIMPYINGRLWDTRDKGNQDFQFSKLARPAATKDEQSKPYIEVYGSKESDGSKVELAVMCPSTELWQKTIRETVLRLMNECGVRGVYIDQIAAAQPRLCFDASHGHPLGGGHWWTESYWKMLEAIRRDMPEGRIITTECNAEPYVNRFDGYLTWHWQYDGQVPAFPAVYGGAIQMFGRAYRGGPTKELALRMKAGQQFVFGEQIGWIGPEVVNEKENFAFLRQLVHLRWRLRRYFYAGQMARPPRLGGQIPNVTADWQWHGVWPVTTPAAMSGAWQLPGENRTALLLVNVGDDPIPTHLEFDASEYGISSDQVRLIVVKSEGEGESITVARRFHRDVTLLPRTAIAWELTPAE